MVSLVKYVGLATTSGLTDLLLILLIELLIIVVELFEPPPTSTFLCVANMLSTPPTTLVMPLDIAPVNSVNLLLVTLLNLPKREFVLLTISPPTLLAIFETSFPPDPPLDDTKKSSISALNLPSSAFPKLVKLLFCCTLM